MKENLSNKLIPIFVVIIFSILVLPDLSAQPNITPLENDIVILSEETDEYFILAQEIAKAENAALINSVDEIDRYSPKYLIYVGAPCNIDMNRLLTFSHFFKSTRKYPAFGIITGKTIESARNLWQRRKMVKAENNFIATDTDYSADFKEGIIFDVSSQPIKKYTLNRENLLKTLAEADYFYWSRHVFYQGWYWYYKKHDVLKSQELPQLKPVVIHTPSCSSVLPSKENNIALEFVEKGAAAYIGHLFTPTLNSGTFIGHLEYLPGKYTWKDFPIGIMAQIQNITSMKACSKLPWMFILGDPRISLSAEKPYAIIRDQSRGNKRIIQGESDVIGVLPLKIENGASWSYIKIKELSSISENDLFNNSKIQSMDLQTDKYLLFLHKGGPFEICLDKSPSPIRIFLDTIKDALDYSWITKGVTKSWLSIFFMLIFLVIVFFKIKRKKSIKGYLPIFLFAMAFAAAQMIFVSLRMNLIDISSYSFYTPTLKLALGFFGSFSSAAGGMILIQDAKKIFMKIIGLLVCVLPQFLLTFFFFVIILVTNIYFKHTFNTQIWNWNPFIFPLILLVIELLIFSTFFIFKDRIYRARKLQIVQELKL